MRSRIFTRWWIPSRVLVLPDAAAVDSHVVAHLVTRADGTAGKIALASGATYHRIYRRIRDIVDSGHSGFEAATFHHLDEFEGAVPLGPESLSGEIAAGLFPDAVSRRGRFVPVDARSGDASVAQHERDLRGCRLAVLGIGANGHLAFNEPGTSFASRSHFASLAPPTREAHSARFPAGRVPLRALTAGIGTILSADEILLVATGRAKAQAVADALIGPLSTDCPASALRLHDRVTVILDRDAASGLPDAKDPTERPGFTLIDRDSPAVVGPTMVVAPHPDDASISCGGLLAILPETASRHIVTFSTGARALGGVPPDEGQRIRESESEEEARILGASVSFLRARAYDTGTFDPADQAGLLSALDRLQPARILAPARSDPHPTHRLCRVTLEDALRQWVEVRTRPVEVWTYEGPWCLLDRDAVNVIVKLDQPAHDRKQAGIRAHRSQIDRVPFHDGADGLERVRAVGFSEARLGGQNARGFDPATRVECYERIILSCPDGR